MFKRRRPAWLLPALSLGAILVLWLLLGWLGSESEDAPAESATGGATLLTYLSPSDGPAEVHAMDLVSGESGQLTSSPGVNSYTLDASGDTLYLSLVNEQNGADLLRIDLTSGESEELLNCGDVFCTNPTLSPNGDWLAFQRGEAGAAALPRIWLLDLNTGDSRPVSAEGHISRDVRWAADEALSYYDQDQAAFILIDLESGVEEAFPNETGGAHAWHPDGGYFVSAAQTAITTEILRGPSGEAAFDTPVPGSQQPVQVLSSQLTRYSPEGNETLFDYEDPLIEDALPAFSPDGQWLAFTRKYLDEEGWTPGRQLWLYNLASGESRALSDSANHQVIAIAWSPDSQQIAYLRANQTNFQEPLELWITNLDGTASQLVAVDAYAPAWAP